MLNLQKSCEPSFWNFSKYASFFGTKVSSSYKDSIKGLCERSDSHLDNVEIFMDQK